MLYFSKKIGLEFYVSFSLIRAQKRQRSLYFYHTGFPLYNFMATDYIRKKSSPYHSEIFISSFTQM